MTERLPVHKQLKFNTADKSINKKKTHFKLVIKSSNADVKGIALLEWTALSLFIPPSPSLTTVKNDFLLTEPNGKMKGHVGRVRIGSRHQIDVKSKIQVFPQKRQVRIRFTFRRERPLQYAQTVRDGSHLQVHSTNRERPILRLLYAYANILPQLLQNDLPSCSYFSERIFSLHF